MTAIWLNINRNGALGNRLFSRAHVYAAAIEFGATVVDWGVLDVVQHFPALQTAPLPMYPNTANISPRHSLASRWWMNASLIAIIRQFRPRRTGRFGPLWSCYWGSASPEEMALDGESFRTFAGNRKWLVLDGYKLRCTPWVRKHAAEIRASFSPPESLVRKWRQIQAAWHAQWRQTIAVHLRATDFRQAQGGRYYLKPEEYVHLLRRTADIDFASTLFVVFSDENFRRNSDFAALERAFEGLPFVFMHGDALDDLAGIMSCDRIVGPASSTFSRWAAFAGGRLWAGVARTMLDDPSNQLAFVNGLIPWDYEISSG